MDIETPKIIEAAIVFGLGVGIALLYRVTLNRLLKQRLSAQHRMILWRIGQYAIAILTLAGVLKAVGVELSVLLGAAGVFTVALAFASQTSASNLISGLFLMGERPFVIGDIIQVNERTGEVVDVGLLSVTLRTFDNLCVRLPNEALFKSEFVNLSRFPIRRCDLLICGPYHADIDNLTALLLTVANDCSNSLDEPKPQVLVKGMNQYGIQLQLSAWASREEYLDVFTQLHLDVLRAVKAANIPLPYPVQRIELSQNTVPRSGTETITR
jgi:small-conductance mechanosensitive channel